MGENVARLRAEVTATYPEVPWKLIKRMRDRLAHHCEATDYEAVWDTICNDFPTIKSYITRIQVE